MPDAFVHRHRILFGQCDPAGIVYTPRVSDFIVEAGIAFLGDVLGGPAERRLFEMGVAPPARKLTIEFLAPMRWDDELATTVYPVEVGNCSFTLAFDGAVADTRTFTASLCQVCVGADTFAPVPMPSSLSQELAVRLIARQ